MPTATPATVIMGVAPTPLKRPDCLTFVDLIFLTLCAVSTITRLR